MLLKERHGARGCKEYLLILELAAKESEAKVDEALRRLLELAEVEISARRIEEMLGFEQRASLREVEVAAVDLRHLRSVVRGSGGAAMSAGTPVRAALLENLTNCICPRCGPASRKRREGRRKRP